MLAFFGIKIIKIQQKLNELCQF